MTSSDVTKQSVTGGEDRNRPGFGVIEPAGDGPARA